MGNDTTNPGRRSAEFVRDTAQTPGSERLAVIAPGQVDLVLWGGLFEVKPGARTGIHHHGEQQTVAYVLQGVCEIRWGAQGEYTARRRPATSSMCPNSCPIWKSIRPDPTRSAGSWCAAPPAPSS